MKCIYEPLITFYWLRVIGHFRHSANIFNFLYFLIYTQFLSKWDGDLISTIYVNTLEIWINNPKRIYWFQRKAWNIFLKTHTHKKTQRDLEKYIHLFNQSTDGSWFYVLYYYLFWYQQYVIWHGNCFLALLW